MLAVDRNRNLIRSSIRAVLGIASVSLVMISAQAQEAAAAAPAQEGALEEIVGGRSAAGGCIAQSFHKRCRQG